MINDLSIISNCTQHLPFTLTIPQIPNMPICNLPLAASPILPLQDILTCLTYGINLSFNGLHGLLLFIVKNMPPIIIDNISKGGIYLEIIDRCPINLNYIKYSSSLVKDILIPGLESFKYITTHASIDLTFIEINVIKVVMLKVIIFEIFTTLKHITSIGGTLINEPYNTSAFSEPSYKNVPDISTNGKRRIERLKRSGANPVPSVHAKKRKIQEETRVNIQYSRTRLGLNPQNRRVVFIYDTLDLFCTSLRLLFPNKPVFMSQDNAGVYRTYIVLTRTNTVYVMHDPAFANTFTEVTHNNMTGVWIHPRYSETLRRRYNISVTSNYLPIMFSGNKMFIAR